jgi:hypothetical protein
MKYLRRLGAVFLLAASISACSSGVLGPYSAIPKTCAGIESEMQTLADKIDRVTTARTAKEIGMMGVPVMVALGAFPPAAAIAVPLASAIRIDIEGDHERVRYLATASLIKDC